MKERERLERTRQYHLLCYIGCASPLSHEYVCSFTLVSMNRSTLSHWLSQQLKEVVDLDTCGDDVGKMLSVFDVLVRVCDRVPTIF